jgi:hypothetical protein
MSRCLNNSYFYNNRSTERICYPIVLDEFQRMLALIRSQGNNTEHHYVKIGFKPTSGFRSR